MLGNTVARGSALVWSGAYRMRYFVAVLQIALLFVQAIPKAIDPDAAAPSLERHAEGGLSWLPSDLALI